MLLPFAAVGVLPGAFVVLGVSLALTGGRTEQRVHRRTGWRAWANRVGRVPVVAVALVGLTGRRPAWRDGRLPRRAGRRNRSKAAYRTIGAGLRPG